MRAVAEGRLNADKIGKVKATGAGILVTANPGCHMQLGAGARMFKASCRVTHIVELLDESYRRAGLYDGDSSQAASDEDVVMSARMTWG
jgi:Fe-S oxidoreductase